MKTIWSVLLLCAFSSTAFADGTIGYSLKTREGFWRVDVMEKESVREGVLSMMGSRYFLTSYWDGDVFHIPFAQNQKDNLTVQVYNEKHSYWYGFLYFNFASRIDVYKDMEKGTMRIVGKIGDKLDFNYYNHINKKGKRTAELYWTDLAAREPVELSLRIDFTPEKAEGSCKGGLYVNSFDQVAVFACKTSGKLMDAFFSSEQDIIAWLVHLLIQPQDDYGGGKQSLASLIKR